MRKTSLFTSTRSRASRVISLLAAAVLATIGQSALAGNGNGNNNGGNNNSSGTTLSNSSSTNNTTSGTSSNNTTTTTGSSSTSTTSGTASGGTLASGEDCFTAVYDQQDESGTYAHYGKGEWDADRQLCIHISKYTHAFLQDTTAIEAAKANPYMHVMYVIDRTQDKLYAPCGVNSDNVGVLGPGTYDLKSLTKTDSSVPGLGSGANCLITG